MVGVSMYGQAVVALLMDRMQENMIVIEIVTIYLTQLISSVSCMQDSSDIPSHAKRAA